MHLIASSYSAFNVKSTFPIQQRTNLSALSKSSPFTCRARDKLKTDVLRTYTVTVRKRWYTIPHEIMGFFAHAQTVDTRPLFPPPTWPGYEANFLLAMLGSWYSLILRPSPSFPLLAVRLSGRGPGTFSHMTDITYMANYGNVGIMQTTLPARTH